MPLNRRQLLQRASVATFATSLWSVEPEVAQAADDQDSRMIIDTHQHLWDLNRFRLPWLKGAPEVLRSSYQTKEYLQATQGYRVKAVYMEVDVDPQQHLEEVKHVDQLARSADHPTVAAVVGGRPASADFASYVQKLKKRPAIKGVRQVLHSENAKRGFCLTPEFVRGVRELGENGLSFDLCMRPTELQDALRLVEQCGDMQFILDHCGNADINAFGRLANHDNKAIHKADPWRRDMEALAKRENVVCKISGIVARARKGWQADDLAPVVNHCLDVFGPRRVVFGGDWPVCLLGSPLKSWIQALEQIVSNRPAREQQMLWRENAQRIYTLL